LVTFINLSTIGVCRIKIIRISSHGIPVKHMAARTMRDETTGRIFAIQ